MEHQLTCSGWLRNMHMGNSQSEKDLWMRHPSFGLRVRANKPEHRAVHGVRGTLANRKTRPNLALIWPGLTAKGSLRMSVEFPEFGV